MDLFEAYNSAVKRGDIVDDAAQRGIIGQLQRIVFALEKPSVWYKPWANRDVSGLYLWGPVGGGKTYLMDLFYQHVSIKQKSRFHFHYFMQQVDQQLRLRQGHPNPLLELAANLAKTTKLLCLDEFLVNDVAHAMILAELLTAMLKHHITLVATANTAPDDLYLNGVRRASFLPAIALIKKHCNLVELIEHRDYRLGRQVLSQAYLFPLDKKSRKSMNEQFMAIAINVQDGGTITIQNRLIEVVKTSDRAVWFDFKVICNLPRCQLDYLEIADHYDTVFVSDIQVLTELDTAKVILLMHLVDVFYDRGVRLVISAAVCARDLYQSGSLVDGFARTLSRLDEMQSEDYLNRHIHTDKQSILA